MAITGWGSDEDKRKCLAAGFDMHLTKAVELAVMEKVLAACAARAEAGGVPSSAS